MYKYWNVSGILTTGISYILNISTYEFNIILLDNVSEEEYKKVTDKDTYIIENKYYIKATERTFTLDDFRKHNEWKDYSVWSPIVSNNDILGCINKYAESFAIRRTPPNTNKLVGRFFPIDIIVPSKECTFDEMHFFVYKDPNDVLMSNITFEEAPNIVTVESDRKELLPFLNISGPNTINKDSFEIFTLNVSNYNLKYPLTIELESINGYLPKTRLVTKDADQFKVYATGLDSGDIIKIKAGFRYYSSLSEKIIKVV